MMEKMKKSMASPKVTAAAFALAVVLLMFSSVGGARAALTYYSENYATRVQMYNIGVSLLENGKKVSWRDYGRNSDGSWEQNTGVLLEDMLEEGETIKIGKKYDERLSVANSGTIGQYVRVSIYKYWLDEKGRKLQGLSPDLIRLDLTDADSGWLVDQEASTPERTVLYYSKVLDADETSPVFADGLTIDDMVASKVTQEEKKEGAYTTVTTVYDYDGVQFCLEARVDAVQEHNAADAIWSAWGRRVSVNNGTLSLK